MTPATTRRLWRVLAAIDLQFVRPVSHHGRIRRQCDCEAIARAIAIAALLVAESVASGEIVNVSVSDCDAAEMLTWCIEADYAYVDATWLDISGAPVREVSSEDFRILIHITDAKS